MIGFVDLRKCQLRLLALLYPDRPGGPQQRAQDGRGQRQEGDGGRGETGRGTASRTGTFFVHRETATHTRIAGQGTPGRPVNSVYTLLVD